MKKLTKTTALILSALMLFGCASNSATGGIGDTTPPGESSVTDSKNESKVESSATENSTAIELSNEKDGFIKDSKGYLSFSYENDKYQVNSVSIYSEREAVDDIYIYPTNPIPNNIIFGTLYWPVAIKCRIAGESLYFSEKNKCGDVTVKSSEYSKSGQEYIDKISKLDNMNASNDYMLGVYTPVIVEEIIDTFSYHPDFQVGDIIYIQEDYNITRDLYSYYKLKNQDTLKFLQDKLDELQNVIDEELKNGDKANEKYITEMQAQVKKYQQMESEYKAYYKFVEESDTPVLNLSVGFPMQKDKSYFAYVNSTKIVDTIDDNSYYYSYAQKFNLGDEEPESLGENEKYNWFHYSYIYGWANMKEKYGDHFKS